MAKWIHCERCGRNRKHYAKNLCKHCYHYSWQRDQQNHCVDCGTPISKQSQRCNSCATCLRWEQGIFGEEYLQELSKAIARAWERGDYDSPETRQKMSESAKARFARGDIGKLFSEEWRRNNSESKKIAWAEGRLGGKEWQHSVSQGVKRAWERGDYEGVFDSDEIRLKRSNAMKAAWERGVFGKEWRLKQSRATKRRWENGDFNIRDTEEWRRKISEAMKAAWERGAFDGVFNEEWRRKRSQAARAQWERGDMDGISVAMKAAWARGDFDNRKSTCQSPTSIEIQTAAALDILGIRHKPQYRPEGCRWPFDEFIPPDILIEVQGDYWHSFEEKQGRDAEKAQWAKKNSYHLIAIWEHEIKKQGAWSLVIERVLPLIELQKKGQGSMP